MSAPFFRRLCCLVLLASSLFFVSASTAFAQVTPTVSGGDTLAPVVPSLSIPIPGVSFSPATQSGDGVDVPFLAQYISGLYRYAISISVLVASLMVVFGGFKYVLGATMSSVGDGKKIIEDAIGGLVVLLCAYLILYVVNPDLVNLRPLHLTSIRPVGVGELTAFETMPIGPVTGPGGGACGSYACPGGNCSSLNVPNYKQSSSPWGGLPYGNHTALISNGAISTAACSGDQNQSRNYTVDGCVGTFQQGACGVTSLAVVLGYYGLNVSMPTRVVPTHEGGATAMHKVDPVDTAVYASIIGARTPNLGTTGAAVRHVEQYFPQFQYHDVAPGQVAATLRQGKPIIASCKGACFFSDSALTPGTKRRSDGGDGHYVVLNGLIGNDTFAIQDVGSGGNTFSNLANMTGLTASGGCPTNRAGRTMPVDNECSFSLVEPKAGAPRTTTATWGTGTGAVTVQMEMREAAGRCTDVPRVAGAGVPAVSGGVALLPFTYLPDGRTPNPTVWPEGQSFVLYPTRLQGVSNPVVRPYVFIMGTNDDNNPMATSDVLDKLRTALSEVAGSKDIVVIVPYHNGGSYSGFHLQRAYDQGMAILRTALPTATTRPHDIVVGGHSGAVCSDVLTSDDVLRNPNLRGVVAYDGCLGQPFHYDRTNTWGSYIVSPATMNPPPGVTIYLSPDTGGMGAEVYPVPATPCSPAAVAVSHCGDGLSRAAKTNLLFGLVPVTCPASARSSRSPVTCFARNPSFTRESGAGELISFQIQSSHTANKIEMTRIAFSAFYSNTVATPPATGATP